MKNKKKSINNKKNIKGKQKRKNKKRKLKGIIKLKLILILILICIIFILKVICKFPIKNFYVEGNTLLTDQEIIDLSSLQDYPSIFKYTNKQIEKKIEANVYIKNAVVKKKKLKEVHIKIEENIVLFYNLTKKKTVLLNGQEVKKKLNGPILINYVPDKIFEKLIKKMSLINLDIINRISEIKYDPSNVDDERFLFTMNDGNYVYITLEKLENINNYVKITLEIIDKFGKKNGILYLDAGEYFEIFSD